jgi:hypothetical protein
VRTRRRSQRWRDGTSKLGLTSSFQPELTPSVRSDPPPVQSTRNSELIAGRWPSTLSPSAIPPSRRSPSDESLPNLPPPSVPPAHPAPLLSSTSRTTMMTIRCLIPLYSMMTWPTLRESRMLEKGGPRYKSRKTPSWRGQSSSRRGTGVGRGRGSWDRRREGGYSIRAETKWRRLEWMGRTWLRRGCR